MAAKILSSLLKKCLEITTALTAEYTQRLTMLLQHSSSLPSLHPLKSSIKKLTCHGGQLHGGNPSDPLPAALPLSVMARQSYAANTTIHKLSIFTNRKDRTVSTVNSLTCNLHHPLSQLIYNKLHPWFNAE